MAGQMHSPEQSCGASALGYGMQCCQESTVQPFRLLSSPASVYDLAATDASFEESRQIREAAMKAHAEVSIRDLIEDSVRARP